MSRVTFSERAEKRLSQTRMAEVCVVVSLADSSEQRVCAIRSTLDVQLKRSREQF